MSNSFKRENLNPQIKPKYVFIDSTNNSGYIQYLKLCPTLPRIFSFSTEKIAM